VYTRKYVINENNGNQKTFENKTNDRCAKNYQSSWSFFELLQLTSKMSGVCVYYINYINIHVYKVYSCAYWEYYPLGIVQIIWINRITRVLTYTPRTLTHCTQPPKPKITLVEWNCREIYKNRSVIIIIFTRSLVYIILLLSLLLLWQNML